jgi:peptide/nickel transport system substrate-binding protein
VRQLLGCVLVTVLLAACAGQGGAQEPAGDGAEAPTELRLAVGGESDDGYDPTLGWGSYGSPLFQSTLLVRDADLEIVPDLATDYEVSGDGLVWTVTIRDDAVFSDGEPVTAGDVAYTFSTAATTGAIPGLEVLADAVAVDDTTVELHLAERQSTFVNRLVTLGVVPEHAHGDGYGRNPVGSGPYLLERWDEGQQLVAVRNPDYYGQAPTFERLVFLFTEEDATMAAARAGEVHVASVPQTLAVEEVADLRLVAVQSVDNRGIMLPHPPAGQETTDSGHPVGNDVTADLAIRRAINVAVDRQALVEGILEGYGSPAHGPVDGLPWWEPETTLDDADPDRAAEILADGGWEEGPDGTLVKDGLRAELTILYPAADSVRQGLAVAVADMLRPLGLDVTPEGASWDQIGERMFSDRGAVRLGQPRPDRDVQPAPQLPGRGRGLLQHRPLPRRAVDAPRRRDGRPRRGEAIPHWRAAQLDDDGNGFAAQAQAAWAWLVNLDHTYLVDAASTSATSRSSRTGTAGRSPPASPGGSGAAEHRPRAGTARRGRLRRRVRRCRRRAGRFVAVRLARLVALLVGVAVLGFLLLEARPVDPVDAYVGADAQRLTAEQRALIAERWGLDDPAPVQLPLAGPTRAGRPRHVAHLQRAGRGGDRHRFPPRCALLGLAWVLSGVLGFSLGLLAAAARGSLLDRAIRWLAYTLASAPTFWVGLLLLTVFAVQLGWAPVCCATPIGTDPAAATSASGCTTSRCRPSP